MNPLEVSSPDCAVEAAQQRFRVAKATYRLSRLTLRSLAVAGVLVTLVAAGIVVADIILRWIGQRGVIGGVDLVTLSVVCVAHFSIPYGIVEGSHIRIDGPVSMLPGRWIALFDLLSALIMLLLFWGITSTGFTQALIEASLGNVSQTLAIPVGWYWAPMLIGSAASLVASLMLGIRSAILFLSGCDIAKEAER